MSYYKYQGVKYGIKSDRSLWKSFVLNIPLVNLIYSKKIRIEVLNRSRQGAPICGMHLNTRVFKNQKQVNFKFMVHETYSNVYMWAEDPATGDRIGVPTQMHPGDCCYVKHEYKNHISLVED